VSRLKNHVRDARLMESARSMKTALRSPRRALRSREPSLVHPGSLKFPAPVKFGDYTVPGALPVAQLTCVNCRRRVKTSLGAAEETRRANLERCARSTGLSADSELKMSTNFYDHPRRGSAKKKASAPPPPPTILLPPRSLRFFPRRRPFPIPRLFRPLLRDPVKSRLATRGYWPVFPLPFNAVFDAGCDRAKIPDFISLMQQSHLTLIKIG